ncbi:MAG TPA: phosphoribosylformylglycinamidine synthase I [Chloroflexi bacterium]|jgi:phosphoribosylformylglycinamidine synthase I|nr:phosphoribosylformylglycinamidine synthase I [Chloroflexota bacterium]
MSVPRIIIMHAPGTNRDRDAAAACDLAGGAPEIVHINQIIFGERRLGDYQMLVLPGGFSYGDDLGAGRLWANDLHHRFREDLDEFVASGRPVIGICNGFQTLVKAGYLPGPAPKQRVTLTFNRHGHFDCRWVRLRVQPDSRCLFTRGLEEDILCPAAHGEGRLAVPDEETRQALWDDGLVALRYVAVADDAMAANMAASVEVRPEAGYPHNPSGSVDDIAGICNAAGNVFGLMPHPENHILAQQHPRWSRGEAGGLGIHLFINGVRAAAEF